MKVVLSSLTSISCEDFLNAGTLEVIPVTLEDGVILDWVKRNKGSIRIYINNVGVWKFNEKDKT